ncbi:MAG TPA: long-chain fatty acid--CoA ligase [Ktedonobacteraceae bacterium]|nr:long-chain fatty acid--CoA ligase [Ktedonobacteraceae bacterium]
MIFVNVGEWLARREQLTPNTIGLIDVETQQRFTYRELNTRARALATILQEDYHVCYGDRVAVLALNAPEYLDALFACTLIGAILVPLNVRLTVRELATILTDCQPKLLLHDTQHHQQASDASNMINPGPTGSVQLLPFSTFPGDVAQLARRAVPFQMTDGEAIALILYTSGTTGAPKGAMLSQRMLTWNAINTQVSWGLRDNEVTPTFAPFFHAGGLNVLTTPLYHCGGTVVLLRSSTPAAVLHAIEQERCTIVFAVPTVFQMLMEHPDFARRDLSSLRFCVTGGSSCPLPIIQKYAARDLVFRQGYGLTEVGVNCFSLAPEDALRKAGSVGKPVFHSRARIANEQGQELPVGTVGELLLAGPHVCSGYWKRPEATAEARFGDWWRTGDLARCDDEGYYAIVGRKKDMLISGGENVYPAEIENVLATHPAIAEVAVIAQPDPKWGEAGLAVVVLRNPHSLTPEEVTAFCADKLARYKIPRSVVFAQTPLPRNAMGKVLKAELRKQYLG